MRNFFVLCALILLGACQTTTPGYQYQSTKPVASYTPNYESYRQPSVNRVMVIKSKNEMYLMNGNRVIKSYDVALGGNPKGHKVQEGDLRTPEGRYVLEYKNEESKFYRSIKISYPNEYDIARAEARGVSPGGDIVIHGLPNELGPYAKKSFLAKNWTQGCIAVDNREMDEIWDMVALNTPIEIYP